MIARRAPWIAVALLLGRVSSGHAQHTPSTAIPDSVHIAAAHDLLEATGTVATMIAVVKANLPAQRAAMPQVPAEFWTRFEARVVKEAPELLDSVAVVYARAFSLDDLRAMTAFYRSPVGQRFKELQPSLVTEGSAMGQRWGARIGTEVAASMQH